jgi:hypothetical protein
MGFLVSYDSAPPSLLLRPYVRRYYVMRYRGDGGERRVQSILPDGFPEAFHVRGPWLETSVADSGFTRISGAATYGQLSRSLRVRFAADSTVFGVVFTPLGYSRVVTMGVQEIGDSVLPLVDVNKGLASLLAATAEGDSEPGIGAFSESMNRVLRTRCATGFAPPPWLEPSLRNMRMTAGLMPVKFYHDLSEVSERYFERRFSEFVGCNPKTYLRILRFARFLDMCGDERKANLALLSTELGFYDQAHLCNEIKRLTGSSPQRYIAGITKVIGG